MSTEADLDIAEDGGTEMVGDSAGKKEVAQTSEPDAKGIYYPNWPYELPIKDEPASLGPAKETIWRKHHDFYKEMLSDKMDDQTIFLIPYNEIPKRTQCFCVTCGAMPQTGLKCGLKNRCFGCIQCGCERGCEFTFPCGFVLPSISFTCCKVTCALPKCSFICNFDQCMTWCPCLTCCAPLIQCICACKCCNPCINCAASCCETCKGCNPCGACFSCGGPSCCSGPSCFEGCCPPSITCCKAWCMKLPCISCAASCCSCDIKCCNPCAPCIKCACSVCSPCIKFCSCILPCVTYGLACRNECRAPCCKCIGGLGCADGNPAGCAACGTPFLKEILFKADSPWEASLKKAIEAIEGLKEKVEEITNSEADPKRDAGDSKETKATINVDKDLTE